MDGAIKVSEPLCAVCVIAVVVGGVLVKILLMAEVDAALTVNVT